MKRARLLVDLVSAALLDDVRISTESKLAIFHRQKKRLWGRLGKKQVGTLTPKSG